METEASGLVRRGRKVKCAAGGGGDGDRITPTISQGTLGSPDVGCNAVRKEVIVNGKGG